MKLNKLISLAIERFEKEFTEDFLNTRLYGEKSGKTATVRESFSKILKIELTNIVKESFRNTETVGEDYKLEITKQGEIDTSKTHWATYGYRTALSDKQEMENQFLNN